MKYKNYEMILGAIKRPDLAIRYIRGKMPSDFDIKEVAKFVDSTSPVIVETGAFDGRDTAAFALFWPEGHIHAFEPLPALSKKSKTILPGFTMFRFMKWL